MVSCSNRIAANTKSVFTGPLERLKAAVRILYNAIHSDVVDGSKSCAVVSDIPTWTKSRQPKLLT